MRIHLTQHRDSSIPTIQSAGSNALYALASILQLCGEYSTSRFVTTFFQASSFTKIQLDLR